VALPNQESKPRRLGPWLPRKPTKTGRQRFVQIDDRLWLAILGTRLPHVAEKVLWAIALKELTQFRSDDPVPISIDELCEVTGFAPAGVYRAVKLLEKLGILNRISGGGRKHKNSYWVSDPDVWW